MERAAIKTTDIEVGRYYSPAAVASIFGRTPEWARIHCGPGDLFPGATKLSGGLVWLIPGADVLALIGAKQIEEDRRIQIAATPSPTELRRRADAAAKKLDALHKRERKAEQEARKARGY